MSVCNFASLQSSAFAKNLLCPCSSSSAQFRHEMEHPLPNQVHAVDLAILVRHEVFLNIMKSEHTYLLVHESTSN